jgi:hypothetical protein
MVIIHVSIQLESPYKNSIGWWQGLKESHVVDSLFERLLVAGKMENPAVCAILGGILGQVASFILLSSYSTFIMLKFLSSEIIIVLWDKTGSDKGNIRERRPD